MAPFFGALGRFSVRYRWVVLVLWLVATAASVHFLPSLSQVVKNDNTQFLPASAPSNVASRLATPFYGRSNNDDVAVVAATRDHRPLDAADEAAIGRLTALAAALPHAVSSRLVGISADRQAAEIDVRAVLSQSTNTPDDNFVHRLRALFTRAGAPPGLVMHTAGDLATTVDQNATSGGIGARTEQISIALIVVLLLMVFRSLLAPVATLFPAVVVLLATGPVVAELGKLGLAVSSVAQLLLIVLVLGAGTDYGLFLVFRLREEVRRGVPHRDAVAVAVARVGESITFSAATVIAALLSLLLATFGVYHQLAVPLAIGIAMMLLAGLTLLPAILAILGRALFWPARPSRAKRSGGAWGGISARVVRRPVQALAAGAVVLGILAAFAFGNRTADFGGAIVAPAHSDSAAGDALLAAHFSVASSNPTNLVMRFATPVWERPGPLAAAGLQLERSPLFSGIIAPLVPNGTRLSAEELATLHRRLGAPSALPAVRPTTGAAATVPVVTYDAYRASAQVISRDGRTVQFLVNLRAGPQGSTAALDAIPAARAALAAVARHVGAVAAAVGGDSSSLYDVNATSGADLHRIVPIAILVIGVLLALLLRSLVAPLYLIASVGLSYLASLGLSVIVFVRLGTASGLSFILPFLMFVFLLALGEDYNILVMSRIREEAHGLRLRDAVSRAMGVTGTTVTSAGLVLAGTFLVFALAGSSGPGGGEIKQVGIGLAAGVLMDTFVVRTLLVPSVVVLLGHWNWWPSGLGHRHRHEPERLRALSGPGPGAGPSPPELPALAEAACLEPPGRVARSQEGREPLEEGGEEVALAGGPG
ncbi:MAG TPA: MMPL family transporter [Acidimicrobiales bacterium]|nr:MMPL family transporter [Acidimicrobiales bacterium]